MERIEPTGVVHRALSAMAADLASPLDRDERLAVLYWLQGMESHVLILLPHDVAAKLAAYTAVRFPAMATALCEALGSAVHVAPPPPRFESPLEIAFFLTWQEQALDLVFPLSPQYPFKGGKFRLDFAYPPLKVGIEIDSYTYHSDREAFNRDRARQREIEADGWRIIRFSGDELRADIARCVREAAHFLNTQQFQHQQREER